MRHGHMGRHMCRSSSFIRSSSTKLQTRNLKAVIEGLKQRHIALAAELGMVDYTDKTLCGNGNPNYGHIEGCGGQNVAALLERIKKLGGDLRYIGMDEPFWFGHVVSVAQDRGAAEAPINAIARNVARQVATAHRYFPEISVGDIEPVAVRSGYVEALKKWLDAYKAATGESLKFFHCDLIWQGNEWQAPLMQIAHLMRANQIAIGVIYDGEGMSGAEWTTSAERHLVDVEGNLALIPDHAIIQSWEPQPLYALPETQRGTMTYLLGRYLAAQTEIKAVKTLFGFKGVLRAHCKPVINAPVSAYEIDDGSLNLTSTASRTATVPVGAVSARIGLRINVESGCTDKSADILLSKAQYVDEKSKQTVLRKVASSEHVVVPAGDKVSTTSGKFPVTPGDTCTFSIPMRVTYSSRDSGNVCLIFLNGAGKEITRLLIPLEPGERLIWTGKTDDKGEFVVPSKTNPPIVRLDFAGDEGRRMASMVLK